MDNHHRINFYHFLVYVLISLFTEQNLKNTKELFESYLNRIFEEKGDDWEEKTLKEEFESFEGL
jgi:hypothetical protein